MADMNKAKKLYLDKIFSAHLNRRQGWLFILIFLIIIYTLKFVFHVVNAYIITILSFSTFLLTMKCKLIPSRIR